MNISSTLPPMTSSERLEYILRVRHASNVSELQALAIAIRRAHGTSPDAVLFTAAIEEKA